MFQFKTQAVTSVNGIAKIRAGSFSLLVMKTNSVITYCLLYRHR